VDLPTARRGIGHGIAVRSTKEKLMDIVYLGVAFLFFALSWGFVRLCERL